jgi:two-component system, cell cycle response regulator
MLNVAASLHSAPSAATLLQAQKAEFAGQLRAAAIDGDDARIMRVLSELLRVRGLTKGQRVSLQLKAMLNLVHCLRSTALVDAVTGLYNRRGFVQIGTRLLDVATRDDQSAHLVCFNLGHLERTVAKSGRTGADALLRQMGNFMRDLFPSNGVYEVLGRLTDSEFVALTTIPEYASRHAIMLRAPQSQTRSAEVPALQLSVGVAHFDPQQPMAIDELLSAARQAQLSDELSRARE